MPSATTPVSTAAAPPARIVAPSRHGADRAIARRMAARLRWLIRGPEPVPDDRQWQRLGEGLWLGDPPADALVAWMKQVGAPAGWSTLEAALRAGEGAGHDLALPQPVRDYVRALCAPPPWLDPLRAARGARVLQATGLHGMMVLRDAGLMAGYQASAINQPLLLTGALHRGAQRRVAETTAWWLACTADGGMAPGAPGFLSTARVRVMHALVRAQLMRSPDWRADDWGLPVNQVDMQATYLAFSVVQLIALRTTGICLTRQQADDVMHLWRHIGWLMGVDEAWLCDDERTGRLWLYQNLLSQAPPDEGSVALARALADEPLQRHYPRWAALRGRVNRARHLSLVRWFVGADGMRRLGLPVALPWYPVMLLGPLALGSLVCQAVPPLARWWRARARARQEAYLRILMGEATAPHLRGMGGAR